jgi:hypothetical protein
VNCAVEELEYANTMCVSKGADARPTRVQRKRLKTEKPTFVVIEAHKFGIGMQSSMHGDKVIPERHLQRQIYEKGDVISGQAPTCPGNCLSSRSTEPSR